MKIEIDLKDVLENEFGSMESLAESIRRQIVDNLTNTLSKGIQEKITQEIGLLIDDQIKNIVAQQMPSLFAELIDKEYQITDAWGTFKGKTTMRNNLIKTLTEQMTYKNSNYHSDKNYFTKQIDECISTQMVKFKEDFVKTANQLLAKEAFDYAVKEFNKKFSF